jgi:hypothetical protein
MYERDEFRCVRCGRYFPEGRGLDAHHRKLRSQGDMGTLDNGVSLCGSGTTGCHGWVHAHPAAAYRLGLLVHSWDDPAQVPVRRWVEDAAERREDQPGRDRTPWPDSLDEVMAEIASDRLSEWEPPG